MIPLVEPIRWMALGASLANPPFGLRLVNEVGPRAFQGPSCDVYGQVEGMLGKTPLWQAAMCEVLGVDNRGKLSDIIIKTLKDEAECAWMIQNPKTDPDQRRMFELSNDISQKAALLAAWAKRIKT